jgi:hypothetical protein
MIAELWTEHRHASEAQSFAGQLLERGLAVRERRREGGTDGSAADEANT